MPKPTKGPRFGGSAAHEHLILANLASSLFEHGKITTTEAKARRLRPFAERLITKAKKGDLHSRRQVYAALNTKTDVSKDIVFHLFDEIAPGYANRPGGYTRITKLGPRKGDNAPMAVIELVEALTVAQEAHAEAEAATKRAARKRTAKKAAEPAPVADAVEPVPVETVPAEEAAAEDEAPVAEAETEVETSEKADDES